MKEFSLMLMAFGGSCAYIAWFLYKRTMRILFEYIKINHHELWLELNCTRNNKLLDSIIENQKTRDFILNRRYEIIPDTFLKDLSSVARVRLFFIIFCFICFAIGIIIFGISSIYSMNNL